MKAHLYRGGPLLACGLQARGFQHERIMVTTAKELLEHRQRCKCCEKVVRDELKNK